EVMDPQPHEKEGDFATRRTSASAPPKGGTRGPRIPRSTNRRRPQKKWVAGRDLILRSSRRPSGRRDWLEPGTMSFACPDLPPGCQGVPAVSGSCPCCASLPLKRGANRSATKPTIYPSEVACSASHRLQRMGRQRYITARGYGLAIAHEPDAQARM